MLAVVNPLHHWQHRVEQYAVVHAVLAVEAERVAVVGGKEVERVHHGVLKPEESPYAPLVAGHLAGEALLGNRTVLLHKLLCHHELLHAVGARVEESHLAQHVVLQYVVGHEEGRVDQYAVEAVKHLGKHTSHRRADDEVGLLRGADAAQKLHRLSRVYGQVGGRYVGPGQQFAQLRHRTRLPRRAEPVDIEYLLSRHHAGKRLYVCILHICCSFCFQMQRYAKKL